MSSDVKDLECLLQTRGRVGALRGTALVPDVSGVVRLRDRSGNEAVVQFLIIVQFVAARVAGRMEALNPLDIVANRAHYVAIVDLRVVDVIEDSHPRRIDALQEGRAIIGRLPVAHPAGRPITRIWRRQPGGSGPRPRPDKVEMSPSRPARDIRAENGASSSPMPDMGMLRFAAIWGGSIFGSGRFDGGGGLAAGWATGPGEPNFSS